MSIHFSSVPTLSHHFLRSLKGRLALNVISFHLLCSLAAAQRSSTTFGPMIDTQLGYVPLGVSTLKLGNNRQGEIVVLAASNPVFRCYTVDGAGTVVSTRSLTTSQLVQQFITGDLDANGTDEIIAYSPRTTTITMFWKTAASWEETNISVTSMPQEVVIADLNNDGQKDLVLFGKSSAGVSVLYGRGARRFNTGPMIFPDISASDLKAADLNGDGITDVLLLNWLSEELMVFYGIGRGVFAEQVSVQLPGEPAHLAIGPVSKRRTVLSAVSVPSERKIVILQGNSTGEFTLQQVLATPSSVNSLAITDGNDDGVSDIVFATASSISVSLGTSHSFETPTPFGTGLSVSGWRVADVTNDKSVDLLAVDQATQRLVIVGGTAHKTMLRWPSQYCVGSIPVGLSLGDYSGDGLVDIAVANSASSTVSFLMNQGNGAFDGQLSLPVDEQPMFIQRASQHGKIPASIVISHPATERITVSHIDSLINSSNSVSLRTASNPYVVLVKESPFTTGLEMVVRYNETKTASVGMSLFEQIGNGKFVENNLTANFPNRVLAMTADDITGNGQYDLVFASREKLSPRTTIEFATAGAKFNFRSVERLFSFTDSTSSASSIFAGYLNPDSLKDIMVLLGPPRKMLGICYSLGAGEFRDSVEWVTGVYPLNDDVILLQDVNGDARNDITYLDGEKERVCVIYQRPEGGFRTPVTVMHAPGVRGLRIAALKTHDVYDVILSHADKGKVSIVFDAFRK